MSDEKKAGYKYRGFGKLVNRKPDEGIQLWASDWNKDYFGFYAWIGQENYQEDIPNINGLIGEQNWRDGDVYVELIDHTPALEHFYHFLYDLSDYSSWESLDVNWWKAFEEKGDDHFKVFRQHRGAGTLEDVVAFEYSTFSDGYEYLETFNPELYKALDEACALDYFDLRRFTQGESGIHWDNNGRVIVVYE